MDWSNWITYANSVLGWVVSLFGSLVDLMMSNPVTGVPVLLGIVGLVFGLVLKFVGAIGSNKSKSED